MSNSICKQGFVRALMATDVDLDFAHHEPVRSGLDPEGRFRGDKVECIVEREDDFVNARQNRDEAKAESNGLFGMGRRLLLAAPAVISVATLTARRGALAETTNTPGVTDTEIKIGQTLPYSGPASAYGQLGRVEATYFQVINDAGGINGRKINIISLDDGFSPPKAVEQIRRLVEQERIAFIFNTLGTPINIVIRTYLNQHKIPHLFIAAGSARFADPEHFPWTIGWQPTLRSEANFYARH